MMSAEGKMLFSLVHDGDPIAHERPRLGRGGRIYTPDKTAKYRDDLTKHVQLATSEIEYVPQDHDTYRVEAIFYRSNRQRIDLDNLFKTVMDAITKSGFWLDDSRVREIAGRLITASKNPGVLLSVYLLGPGQRSPNPKYAFIDERCPQCGRLFSEAKSKSYPSTIRKYCSRECADAAKRESVNCRQCGKEFSIPRSLHRKNSNPNGGFYARQFCSRACSIKYHSELKRKVGKESDRWVCTMCGGRVSRKEYKVCRACSMKTRSDPTTNYWKLRHRQAPKTEIKIRPLGEDP